jgi:cytoskeletal protein CcmA (bactofilin family)
MFGRKPPTDMPKATSDSGDELEFPAKPGGRPPAAAGPMRPPIMPPRPPAETTRPQTAELPRRLDGSPIPSPGSAPGAGSLAKRDADLRKLIVGREISLSGEITSCDRLVVEGSVEANLANCRDIEISESGFFKGSASIDEAEIRGRFEGILNVRRRLLIKASGKVTGTVRYGQIEIECGGQVSGDMQAQPANEPPEAAAPVAALGSSGLGSSGLGSSGFGSSGFESPAKSRLTDLPMDHQG